MKKLILIFFVFISAYGFSQVEKTFQNIKVDSIKGTDGYNIIIGTGVETTDVRGTLLNNGLPISGGGDSKWSDNPEGGILYPGKTTSDTTATDIFILGSDTITGFEEYEPVWTESGTTATYSGRIKATNIPRDVMAYGATGDGETDDWDSIQACINLGTGTIIIGKPITDIFRISQALKPQSNQTIILDGTLKAMDADTALVAFNVTAADSVIRVSLSDIPDFAIGQHIVIWDDSSHQDSTGWYYVWGGGGIIDTIIGDSIMLETKIAGSGYQFTRNYLVSLNAKVAQQRRGFTLEDVDNVTITGEGRYDGNRSNQPNAYPYAWSSGGFNITEDRGAGTAIRLDGCDNIKIEGIEIFNPFMFGISIEDYENIKIDGIHVKNAESKNILFHTGSYSWVNNVRSDSARWEDGLAWYSSAYNSFVDNYTSTGCGRSGIFWGSVTSKYLQMNNIKVEGAGEAAINLHSGYVNSSNITILNSTKNGINIDRNGSNVNLSNILISNQNSLPSGSTNYGSIYLSGASESSGGGSIGRINLSNLTIENSFGNAIYADPSTNEITGVKITGGSIYNHSGQHYNLSTSDVTFSHFDPIFIPDASFTSHDDLTQWLWRADSLVYYTGAGTVDAWVDLINRDSAYVKTAGASPDSAGNYVGFSSNDWLEVVSPATSQDLGTGDFTISGMVRFGDAAADVMFGKRDLATDQWGVGLSTNYMYIRANIGGVNYIYSYMPAGTITTGVDYIFSISVKRDGTIIWYFNGDSTISTMSVVDNTDISYVDEFNIGAQGSAGNNALTGRIYWMQLDNGIRDIDWHYNFYSWITEWNAEF